MIRGYFVLDTGGLTLEIAKTPEGNAEVKLWTSKARAFFAPDRPNVVAVDGDPIRAMGLAIDQLIMDQTGKPSAAHWSIWGGNNDHE